MRKLLLWAPFVLNLCTFRVYNFQDSKCVSVKNDKYQVCKEGLLHVKDYLFSGD